jgi:putative ABC transport system ATP-binding protein
MVTLTQVSKVFEGKRTAKALDGVNLSVARGELVAIVGPSGSGKSTLLHLIGGSDRPTAGRVMVDGIDLSRADEDQRAKVRGRHVGIVFQSQNLAPFLTLRENVSLAAGLAGRPADAGDIGLILDRLGLGLRADHRPAQLSGGEQQRAGLAVILAASPPIVLADEITGELDSASADRLLDLLADIRATTGMTVVMATHDHQIARRAERIVELRDGRVAAGATAS